MRIVFAGSPAFVVPVLTALHESRHQVIAVITPPDKSAGRGHKLTKPPVKTEAVSRGITVEQPANVNAAAFLHKLCDLKPDAIAVAAYGQILSEEFLDLPPRGVLNVHLSLLPKYRGAAPVAWAIMRGETETGVTLMSVTPALDAGPVLTQRSVEIGPDETTGDLQKRLGLLAAPMAVEALDRVEDGTAVFAPQDESKATSAPALKKKRGFISWRRSALEIRNLVRAMNPWPLAYAFYRGPTGPTQRVIVLDAVPLTGAMTGARTGQVVRCETEGPVVAVGDGCVLLRRVKPAGGREMDGAAFVRGHHIEVGGRFGKNGNG